MLSSGQVVPLHLLVLLGALGSTAPALAGTLGICPGFRVNVGTNGVDKFIDDVHPADFPAITDQYGNLIDVGGLPFDLPLSDSEKPLRTALANAKPGDTIRVPAGLYCLTQPLVVPAGVTLAGETEVYDAAEDGMDVPTGSRERQTILDATNIVDLWCQPQPGACVSYPGFGAKDGAMARILVASEPHVTVRGLTFRNPLVTTRVNPVDPSLATPISFVKVGVYGGGTRATKINIEGNQFGAAQTDNFYRAVYFGDGFDVEVNGNVVQTSPGYWNGSAAFEFAACDMLPGPAIARATVHSNYIRVAAHNGIKFDGAGAFSFDVIGCHLTGVAFGNKLVGLDPDPHLAGLDPSLIPLAIEGSAGTSFGDCSPSAPKANDNSVSLSLMHNDIKHWGSGINALASLEGCGSVNGNKLTVNTAGNRISDTTHASVFFAASLSSFGPSNGNQAQVVMLGDELIASGAPWGQFAGVGGIFGHTDGTNNSIKVTLRALDLDGTGMSTGVDNNNKSCSPANPAPECQSMQMTAFVSNPGEADGCGNSASCKGVQCPAAAPPTAACSPASR